MSACFWIFNITVMQKLCWLILIWFHKKYGTCICSFNLHVIIKFTWKLWHWPILGLCKSVHAITGMDDGESLHITRNETYSLSDSLRECGHFDQLSNDLWVELMMHKENMRKIKEANVKEKKRRRRFLIFEVLYKVMFDFAFIVIFSHGIFN